jgi:hypothetical protein
MDPKTGIITCANVYTSLKPWPKGTKIKELRVIQLFPKATQEMNYPNIGVASESLARGVLGTVPVEEDGSVRFTAPAGKTLYFQALDENGLAVQSMMSATYVHPGEELTCHGCHENKHRAPAQPAATMQALQRPPSILKPDVDGTYPLSFPRLIQPILDKNCVPCHEQGSRKHAPDLSRTLVEVKNGRDRTPSQWYQSFASLKDYAYGASGRPPGRLPVRSTPGEVGAQASRLYHMLKDGHYDLELSDEDMHRITVWLDCNSNFYGAYHDVERQLEGALIIPELE